MNRSLVLVAGVCACIAANAHGQVVLNEVYTNPPGSGTIDDRWEYIEVYGPAGMSLTGYMIASVFGGGDPDSDDIPGPLPAGWDGGDEVAEIDEAWSLDGLSIGANGLLVLYNNAQPSQAAAFFAPGTATATFQISHCPTVDIAGRVKNDGSATIVLLRKRPFHAVNASGVSVYDGVAGNTIVSGPLTYPSSIRYAWRKDINPDVNFDGRVDFNGIGTLVNGGGAAPAETPINSERLATPPVGSPRFLEPYQMVDDIAWSNGGGKEYVRSSQQEISDTSGFNPDAVSRVSYLGANPQAGHVFIAGEMRESRMADEELIYGDIFDSGPLGEPLITYNAPFIGGPTDPNGQTYNELGQPDASGQYRLDNINLTGYKLTPGAFNDVDSSGAGGISISQFRFVAGDFNFDGVADCTDLALITASVGVSLDETTLLTSDNNTATLLDDFTYTGWRWQGREFNGLLAMIRMNMADGATGEWNSGITVTQADVDSFNAGIAVNCSTCGTADFDGDGDTGTDADIEAFFACLGGSCCGTCGTADFDGDGDTGTDADIEAFFRVLGGGSC
jgi:hypothetical protein